MLPPCPANRPADHCPWLCCKPLEKDLWFLALLELTSRAAPRSPPPPLVTHMSLAGVTVSIMGGPLVFAETDAFTRYITKV